MASFDFTSKPSGLWKAFLGAPTWIFRAHLGFVFGNRFLMIEHHGRKSQKPYRTTLEVAGRNPDKHEWIVTSGTGPKADWYQNIKAGGVDAVWIGSSRTPADLRFLEAEEAGAVFAQYEHDHGKAAVKLMDMMGVSYDGTDAGRIDMMTQIPMVAFIPAAEPSASGPQT
ncbi:MAG: nitroreductase family deazaflavin-dependent oxidoreductase [Acidimicrobiia bacterium]